MRYKETNNKSGLRYCLAKHSNLLAQGLLQQAAIVPDAPAHPGGALPVVGGQQLVLVVELLRDVDKREAIGAIQVDHDRRPIRTLFAPLDHPLTYECLVLGSPGHVVDPHHPRLAVAEHVDVVEEGPPANARQACVCACVCVWGDGPE